MASSFCFRFIFKGKLLAKSILKVLIIFGLVLVFYFTIENSNIFYLKRFELPVISSVPYRNFNVTIGCKLPDSDLIDPVSGLEWFIKKYPDTIECHDNRHIDSYVDGDGVLRIINNLKNDFKTFYTVF